MVAELNVLELNQIAVRDALSGPAPVMFLALVSFGVIARQAGFDLGTLGLSTGLLWALPAQIAHAELVAGAAGLIAVTAAVAIINLRFLPMIATLYSALPAKKHISVPDLLVAHLVTPATWTWCMARFAHISIEHRENYFLWFAMVVWMFGLAGALLGFFLESHLSENTRLLLTFIAPMYMSLLLAQVRNHQLVSVVTGGVAGYLSFQFSQSMYLLIAATVGGAAGFVVWRAGRSL